MLTTRYTAAARQALAKHSNRAATIRKKIAAYAVNPESQRNNVIRLAGEPSGYRLRVGDFRVLFRIEDGVMVIFDVGPRGSIYGP